MFNDYQDLTLSFEAQLKKERGHKLERDLKAYKNSAPKSPSAVTSTFDNGMGGVSTTKMQGNNQITTYAPSDFEKSQYDYYKTVTPQLQNNLYSQNTADSQATAYAQGIKEQGLKRFGIDAEKTLGQTQASNARRFGSLANSDYDSSMKTYGREMASGLQDLNSAYDTNKTSYMNDYNNRYINLLASANGIYTNSQNNANNLNSGSMSGYQAGNAFNQTNHQNAMQQYLTNKASKERTYTLLGGALGGVGGALEANMIAKG